MQYLVTKIDGSSLQVIDKHTNAEVAIVNSYEGQRSSAARRAAAICDALNRCAGPELIPHPTSGESFTGIYTVYEENGSYSASLYQIMSKARLEDEGVSALEAFRDEEEFLIVTRPDLAFATELDADELEDIINEQS